MPKSLEERLKNHPQLKARFESMLDVVEANEGVLDNANDAEEQVIEEVRRLGGELLQGWGAHKEEQRHRRAREADSELKIQAKKN